MIESDSQKYAFFKGEIVPLEQAKVSVMTHALNYGTGVFEGIRGYWNADEGEIYLVLLREHFRRFIKNCTMVCIDLPYSADDLSEICIELVRRHGFRQDVYIRPLAYKSSETIGVSMHGVSDDFTMFVSPFGNYVDIDRGLSVCVSSWVRTDDNAIPARGKVTGNYINSALAKNEALMNGFDEAVVLNSHGYVSEASAANIFLVRDNVLVTPGYSETILEGLTRNAVITLAAEELGIATEQRAVARSELYYADEMFFVGTGVQVAPITSVDHRVVGTGQVGPVSTALQTLYLDTMRGLNPNYMKWLTPVNAAAAVSA